MTRDPPESRYSCADHGFRVAASDQCVQPTRLDPLNPMVQDFLREARAAFLKMTGNPAASDLLSIQALENLRNQQAESLAFFDDFWLFAAVSVSLLVLVLFMRPAVAEKGAHIAAE